jgi:hypothetical protein
MQIDAERKWLASVGKEKQERAATRKDAGSAGLSDTAEP